MAAVTMLTTIYQALCVWYFIRCFAKISLFNPLSNLVNWLWSYDERTEIEKCKYFAKILWLVGGQCRTQGRSLTANLLPNDFLPASLSNLFNFITSYVKHLFICKLYFFLNEFLPIHQLEDWWFFSPFCMIFLYTIDGKTPVNYCWKYWCLFYFWITFIINFKFSYYCFLSICNFFKLIKASNSTLPKSWYAFLFFRISVFRFLKYLII